MSRGAGGQIVVLNTNTKRETGRQAQIMNIRAGKAVSEIIRTTLGPKAMLKMILDAQGGIHTTSDGNAILRELDVVHPCAKTIIQLSRTQDEEVGDGTTSVIILAGEVLSAAEKFILDQIHPTIIVQAFFNCLQDAVSLTESFSVLFDPKTDPSTFEKVVDTSLGTKFTKNQSLKIRDIAIKAVQTVRMDNKDIDTKRYVKIEKIPGGTWNETTFISGVILNKDILHPTMRRRIANPKILLLDVSLEYQKGESQTQVEIENSEDHAKLLKQEEQYVNRICSEILKVHPDLVVTEKGICDQAIQIFASNNISALRRLRKSDNERLARATHANICGLTSEVKESDLGTCGLFEVRQIGDEYYAFIEDCYDPKACTILLRGPSKDVLNEVERNLHDALAVVRNIYRDPRIVPGGGAIEIAVSTALLEKGKSIKGLQQEPYLACARTFEVIPRILSENCGVKALKLLTELKAKHVAGAGKNSTWGIDGVQGVLADMKVLGIWDSLSVKVQAFKTAIEAACSILRIDDVVSGITKKKEGSGGKGAHADEEDTAAGGGEGISEMM